MFDATSTFLLAISIFMACLTMLGVACFRPVTQLLEAKIGAENARLALEVSGLISEEARRIVWANEQVGRKGQEAKAYALEALQDALNQRGIRFNMEVIDNAIEAAVYELFQPDGEGTV